MGGNGRSSGVNEGRWVLLCGAEACFASHLLSLMRVRVCSKFQLPNHVKLVLYDGNDQNNTYAHPRSPEAYAKLITNECANESHSVQEMRHVWKWA